MKIIFESSLISCQGTSVAVYDYAHYNEELLGNTSVILAKTPEYLKVNNPHQFKHDPLAIEKFEKRFKVLYYDSWNHAEELIKDENADIFYTLKGGYIDEIITRQIPTCVHSVFKSTEFHGDIFAYISLHLSNTYSNGMIPVVPHMISLPDIKENLREQLNIPSDAIVIGRHGSRTTFNIPFVIKAVNKIVDERKDIYFLLLNTDEYSSFHPDVRLIKHPRIIHLPTTFDSIEKSKFINTCDAMLHARADGESFGLAPAEFSFKNKPVITFSGRVDLLSLFPYGMAHVEMLGDKAIYYDNYEQLCDILLNFQPSPDKDWDAYSKDYNPISVIKKFDDIFLSRFK